MYSSQEVYLALLMDKPFRSRMGELCKLDVIPPINVDELFADDWVLKLPQGVFCIGGRYTVDVELLFSEDDMRHLFDWEKKNFARICEFAAAIYSEVSPE